MTYGQIAEQAGSRRCARQVVRILHSSSSTHRLPWHRVVNAQGQVALVDDQARHEQITRLREEGVQVEANGKLSLDKYLFRADSLY